MFILILWLQGIWLPRHGHDFASTPIWAGISMLPLSAGLLVAGPASGALSDRYGARGLATGGMVLSAMGFGGLILLPIDFAYPLFAAILFLMGVSMGMFLSPNRASVMNSLPAWARGAGGGMAQTFQNSAQVLSIGVFFTLMTLGLAASLPTHVQAGLEAHHVPVAAARHVAELPPISVLFGAFLGYNPMAHLLGPGVVASLPAGDRAYITGHAFFPSLISEPFQTGLHAAFTAAIVACLVAAVASALRSSRRTAPATHVEDVPSPSATPV
jgi:MFS family permease